MGILRNRTWTCKKHKRVSFVASNTSSIYSCESFESHYAYLRRCERMNLTVNTNAKALREHDSNQDAVQCYTSAITRPPSSNNTKDFKRVSKPNVNQWRTIIAAETIPIQDRFLIAYVRNGEYSTLIMDKKKLKKAMEESQDLTLYIPTMLAIAEATVAVDSFLDNQAGSNSLSLDFKNKLSVFIEKEDFIRAYLFKRLQSKSFRSTA